MVYLSVVSIARFASSRRVFASNCIDRGRWRWRWRLRSHPRFIHSCTFVRRCVHDLGRRSVVGRVREAVFGNQNCVCFSRD